MRNRCLPTTAAHTSTFELKPAEGVQPHVPDVYTRPHRYAVLICHRGTQTLRAIVSVEPFEPGRWRVSTPDGWVLFDEGQTWENQEAALDAEFRRMEEDEASPAQAV